MTLSKRAGLVVVAFILALAALSAFQPAVRKRADIFLRMLQRELPGGTWTRVVAATAPEGLQSSIRAATIPGPQAWVQSFDPPALSDKKGWTVRFLFNQPTTVVKRLDCHVSTLKPGVAPHPPHRHKAEELLIALSGELEVVRANQQPPTTETILPGQMVYHSSDSVHTIQAASSGPASYLVLKWLGTVDLDPQKPLRDATFRFDSAFEAHKNSPRPFRSTRLFEVPTRYLTKLHSHATTLKPGGGYDPHPDPYDIVVVLLKGEVETLGRRVQAGSAIFFPADRSHGMRNVGGELAEYLVFELHGPAEW